MKRKYTVLPFGKKGKRISVVLCRKPMQNDLSGMVCGKALGQNIAIVLDDASFKKCFQICLYCRCAENKKAPVVLKCRSKTTGVDMKKADMSSKSF